MINDSSAVECEETPHSVNITPTQTHSTQNQTHDVKRPISVVLKRRAESVIRDKSIDAQTRALIRYALETNDAWLPKLVRCVEVGESVTETIKRLADASDH